MKCNGNDRTCISMTPSGSRGTEHCNGCSLCMLSCPVWHNTGDPFLTFCGRARILQSGTEENIRDSLNACILCGSCEPLCSYDINTVDRTIDARSGSGERTGGTPVPVPGARANGKVLLANSLILNDDTILKRTLEALGEEWSVFEDNGEDISASLEAGNQVDFDRVNEFIDMLSTADEIVTTDGLVFRIIKRFMPELSVMGLGERMITRSVLEEMIGPEDLYIIDSRTYHSDFKKLASIYDGLRQNTGCMMNLDLNRVATPSGVTIHNRNEDKKLVDPARQVAWILEGRPAKRIIVEKIEDKEPFSGYPADVLFITEVLENNGNLS